MSNSEQGKSFLRFPAMSWGAEALVMGYFMRRNILTFKAPPNNEGYDLICMHPDPRQRKRQLRIQVKSRYATDCNPIFLVKRKALGAFDYLVAVFLNVGYFYSKAKHHKTRAGARAPEFYTFPRSFIEKHLDESTAWHKIRTRGLDIERYKNEAGFEYIARRLKIEYPARGISQQ